jgi:hypothetical protein
LAPGDDEVQEGEGCELSLGVMALIGMVGLGVGVMLGVIIVNKYNDPDPNIIIVSLGRPVGWQSTRTACG